MKSLLIICLGALVLSCNDTNQNEKKSTNIKIKIFERIDIGFDYEGAPIALGEMVEVENFEKIKTHTLDKYDYIEKIQITGDFINAKIRFINSESGCIVKELNNVQSKETLEFIGPNPDYTLDVEYEEWMLNAKWHSLQIEVINDQRLVFEGVISNKKNK
ncbi:hypothetical protein N9I21_04830 [Crocinitomicaceae bacterium]|nr:hypothetical protein [Crocinitomicaceae bacterium]